MLTIKVINSLLSLPDEIRVLQLNSEEKKPFGYTASSIASRARHFRLWGRACGERGSDLLHDRKDVGMAGSKRGLIKCVT